MMSATVIGDEALAAKFTAAAVQLQAERKTWLPEVAEMVETAIEGNIARQGLIDTGDLIDSGRIFYQTANGISVGFGNMLGYAAALEFGSHPHWIDAGAGWWSSASNLYFQLPSGKYFYGPRVWHPGNQPYKFINRGAMEAFYPICLFFMAKLRGIFGGSL